MPHGIPPPATRVVGPLAMPWKYKTNAGHVNYTRPKHFFGPRDITRLFLKHGHLILERIPQLDGQDRTTLLRLCQAIEIMLEVLGPMEGFEGVPDIFEKIGEEIKGATKPAGVSIFAKGPCGVAWILLPIQPC